MTRLTCFLLPALLITTLPALAQAPGSKLNQRYWLQLGAFHPSIDSNARVDHPQSGQAGTSLNFENELALADKKTLPTLLLGARLDERWRMEFEYFALKRTGNQTLLAADVNFDDTTYTASASLASEFSSKVYRLNGGYSFYKTPEAEAGVVLGLHVTDFRIALEGQGSINGSPVAVRTERKEKVVPLPTLGLYGAYAIAPDWAAAGRIDVLSLKVGDYKGRLLNLQANVFYRFNPNLALGMGYRYDDYRIKVSRADLNGQVEYRFSGPQVVLDAGF